MTRTTRKPRGKFTMALGTAATALTMAIAGPALLVQQGSSATLADYYATGTVVSLDSGQTTPGR